MHPLPPCSQFPCGNNEKIENLLELMVSVSLHLSLTTPFRTQPLFKDALRLVSRTTSFNKLSKCKEVGNANCVFLSLKWQFRVATTHILQDLIYGSDLTPTDKDKYFLGFCTLFSNHFMTREQFTKLSED